MKTCEYFDTRPGFELYRVTLRQRALNGIKNGEACLPELDALTFSARYALTIEVHRSQLRNLSLPH